MYTRFNDNTIETKFIKQLVALTQVPFISTWKPGDFAIRGMLYITKDAIWRCNHTGYPQHLMDVCTAADHCRIQLEDGTIVSGEGALIPYFTKVAPYIFGQEYYNITGSYQSNILGYDATTHFYLGQYLRMMRDIYDLDMMPFYNCFCGEYVSGFDFNENSEIIDSTTDYFKIASVPVKFGRTYHIAINSEVPVETMLVVYGKKGIITDLTKNLNDNITVDQTGSGIPVFTPHRTYQKYNKISFQHPVIYRTKDWELLNNTYKKINGRYDSSTDDAFLFNALNYDQALGQFEKYLRLLIKVPSSNASSLVVIEGDYTLDQFYESENFNSVTWTNMSLYDTTVNNKLVTGEMIRPVVIKNYAEALETAEGSSATMKLKESDETDIEYQNRIDGHTESRRSTVVDDQLLLSPLGLLQMSDGNNYAFSNRLIEYLLLNVINPLEEFGQNITRIQEYARSQENTVKNYTTRFTGVVTPGVWDDDLRKYLFDLVKDSKYLTTKVDLTGYVDKDTERIITRGLKV